MAPHSLDTPLNIINIAFLGTPDFSVPCLQACLNSEALQIQAVITQPDRPAGRGKKILPTPVKQHVLDNASDIPIYQPSSIRKDAELIGILKDLNPDYLVTIAFGQILSQEVLDIPKYGTVNVHASLLPKFRGANPIQQAIIQGETETGLTTMLTDIGVDTGDMLLKTTIPITSETTSLDLQNNLSQAAGELLINTLTQHASGKLLPTPQNHDEATHAPKAKKEDATINWHQSAQQLDWKIRGQQPWPGAVTLFDGSPLKIIHSTLIQQGAETSNNTAQADKQAAGTLAGTLLGLKNGVLSVTTGDGVLGITQVQPTGKKPMPVSDWINGLKAKGIRLNHPDSEQPILFQSEPMTEKAPN